LKTLSGIKKRSRDANKHFPKSTTLARTKQTIRKPSYNNMSATQPTTPSIDSLLDAADAIIDAADKVEAQGVVEAKFTGAKIPLSPTIDLSGSGEGIPQGSFNSVSMKRSAEALGVVSALPMAKRVIISPKSSSEGIKVPSAAVAQILNNLDCLPDGVAEVESLRKTLRDVRFSFTLTDLVRLWVQDITFIHCNTAASIALKELLLLLFCYASDAELRVHVKHALSLPNNLAGDTEKLVKVRKGLLHIDSWPDLDTQKQAIGVIRGLQHLFYNSNATPTVFWNGRYAYESVDDCLAKRNNL
jgi:hypothetical protein